MFGILGGLYMRRSIPNLLTPKLMNLKLRGRFHGPFNGVARVLGRGGT